LGPDTAPVAPSLIQGTSRGTAMTPIADLTCPNVNAHAGKLAGAPRGGQRGRFMAAAMSDDHCGAGVRLDLDLEPSFGTGLRWGRQHRALPLTVRRIRLTCIVQGAGTASCVISRQTTRSSLRRPLRSRDRTVMGLSQLDGNKMVRLCGRSNESAQSSRSTRYRLERRSRWRRQPACLILNYRRPPGGLHRVRQLQFKGPLTGRKRST